MPLLLLRIAVTPLRMLWRSAGILSRDAPAACHDMYHSTFRLQVSHAPSLELCPVQQHCVHAGQMLLACVWLWRCRAACASAPVPLLPAQPLRIPCSSIYIYFLHTSYM